MTPQEHKTEAERLLTEGVKVVNQISHLDKMRQGQVITEGTYESITASMDERGKKAMGIWAQAQVHATLSTGKVFSPSGEYR
jgi:primase-polymerase (primpol)-like protein